MREELWVGVTPSGRIPMKPKPLKWLYSKGVKLVYLNTSA
jgi:hypothetical protein